MSCGAVSIAGSSQRPLALIGLAAARTRRRAAREDKHAPGDARRRTTPAIPVCCLTPSINPCRRQKCVHHPLRNTTARSKLYSEDHRHQPSARLVTPALAPPRRWWSRQQGLGRFHMFLFLSLANSLFRSACHQTGGSSCKVQIDRSAANQNIPHRLHNNRLKTSPSKAASGR